MPQEVVAIAIVTILALFVFLPWMLFHYITLWRNQKTLKPDDEKIMEDLWRSAKRMERRIEALEALVDGDGEPRSTRSPADTDYRRDR